MELYVDSISGVDHLVRMSNFRFEVLNKNLDISEKDELMQIIKKFDKCYFDGSVSSNCGRRVISVKTLTNNIVSTIENLTPDQISCHTINKIIEAAFRGITDNCARFDQCDAYRPKENMSKIPWIGVDLDGTLAYNEEGVYKGGTHIGEPIPKMVNRVKKWISEGKTVKIFTARNDRRKDEPETIKAIEDWCKTHIGQVLEITNVKDNQCKQIWDDRAYGVVRNTGNMRSVDESL